MSDNTFQSATSAPGADAFPSSGSTVSGAGPDHGRPAMPSHVDLAKGALAPEWMPLYSGGELEAMQAQYDKASGAAFENTDAARTAELAEQGGMSRESVQELVGFLAQNSSESRAFAASELRKIDAFRRQDRRGYNADEFMQAYERQLLRITRR